MFLGFMKAGTQDSWHCPAARRPDHLLLRRRMPLQQKLLEAVASWLSADVSDGLRVITDVFVNGESA
jgi:hypothetical protein